VLDRAAVDDRDKSLFELVADSDEEADSKLTVDRLEDFSDVAVESFVGVG
jgi:hypothetical protein